MINEKIPCDTYFSQELGIGCRKDLQIKELEEKLKDYESGFKGACPTCEIVGEVNIELEEKLAEQSELLAKAVEGLKFVHRQILKELGE